MSRRIHLHGVLMYHHNHAATFDGHPIVCVGDEKLPRGPLNFRICWQVDVSQPHAERFGLNSPNTTGPCLHLGAATGETVLCKTCGGGVRAKTFVCAVHGACTLARRSDAAKGCCHDQYGKICEDYAPGIAYGAPIVRHLCYHVAPFSGNGAWQRNVALLRKRIGLFNGRRIVAIVTGDMLDQPDAVKREFAGDVDEFIVLPNDSALREVVTFVPLLERAASLAPHEVTFYGHTKGASRAQNDGEMHLRWADMMYETCLDYWPLIERLLTAKPLAGSGKKVGAGFGSCSAFHYSGTFFWLRNAMVFNRNWREVDQQWWGTEAWPGLHFTPREAAAIFLEGVVPSLNFYEPGYWEGLVESELARWREKHAGERQCA